MFRFNHYLSIILFTCSAHAAAATNSYLKPGAPVRLSKPAYQLDNSDDPQTVLLELTTTAIGTMELRFNSSTNTTIIENTLSKSVPASSLMQTHLIPLRVSTLANSKSYVDIFVRFSDQNGAVTSRAISAILNSGQPPSSKPSGPPLSVISMPAIETIKRASRE